MLVEEIMSREPVTIGPGQTVRTAMALAKAKRIRHIPVTEGPRLVGLISDRDLRDAKPSILGSESDEFLDSTLVRDIMHTSVITVHPLDTIGEAARLLCEHRIGCLPVVKGGELAGIVTETDILRSLVSLTGVDRPGSQIEIEVDDRPGLLAEAAGIIKYHHINVISVLTTPARVPDRRVLVFRVGTIDPRQIISDFEAHGYQVRWAGQPQP